MRYASDEPGEGMEKKILEFLEKDILLSPDLVGELDELNPETTPDGPMLLDKRSGELQEKEVDWRSLDEAKARAEQGEGKAYEKMIEMATHDELQGKPGVKVVRSYTKKSKKRVYEDFVSHFNQRFKTLSAMLRKRTELQGATAITRLKHRERNERVALIAMIMEKSITKNNNVILTLEDQTGTFKALVSNKHKELFALARDLVLDEVIGVTGALGDGIIFINELFFPDVPLTHELKKGPDEEYLAVIGDPQVGGKEFLAKDFEKLLCWFNGEIGNEEQKTIAAKTKYVIVVGDLVEGAGVYPGQEEDLYIKDIKAQYAEFARLIRRIPKEVQIICIPGNHDAGRIAEPQPPIYKDFAGELYEMPNVTMVSSPSIVNFGANGSFPGLNALIYHGYSLIYYADNVPSIRERGGQKRSELIMKFLLQRRHLAPTHASNMYIPDPEQDPLVIDLIPDFFITGHIHRVASATYRGVTMLNASAWCDITDNQEKRGLEPQPARLPLINLQTRDVKVINFYSGKGKGRLTAEEMATKMVATEETP